LAGDQRHQQWGGKRRRKRGAKKYFGGLRVRVTADRTARLSKLDCPVGRRRGWGREAPPRLTLARAAQASGRQRFVSVELLRVKRTGAAGLDCQMKLEQLYANGHSQILTRTGITWAA